MFFTKKRIIQNKIIDFSRRMNSSGLNQGSSGNISVRFQEGMLITPTSIPYEKLKPNDIVYINLDKISKDKYRDKVIKSKKKPSSEWQMHASILKSRIDINAVLHCHSIYATALSCHRKKIPSFHYMTAISGGMEILCSNYATFGSKEIAKNTLEALQDRNACLLANHGQISIGVNIEKAFSLAIEIETLSHIYLEACKLGEPMHLSAKEMENVLSKFKKLDYKD